MIKEPQQIIRLYGGGLAHAVNYHLEKLRCNLCLTVFTAALPKEAGPQKYTTGFKAVLAVNHYYLGQPFYRTAQYQSYIGVPLPASNQFSCMEEIVNCVLPVYQHILYLAAQAQSIHTDDTKVRIHSLIQENKSSSKDGRKGMFATAMIAKLGEYEMSIVMTGRNHAGENLEKLLKQRQQVAEKMLLMCDALSRNIPKDKALKQSLIICYCLVHARRNFFDCQDEDSVFCNEILGYFSTIYKSEQYCNSQSLSDPERLSYHRQYSRPAMKSLYRCCLAKLTKKDIEPNSSLGKAIDYMINHRRALTRFLRIAGAPLDNNKDERLIKKIINYRKNSLAYYNEYGAFIGDVLMTLIFTVIGLGQNLNPVHYLTALQDNARHVYQDPSQWLPWNYQAIANENKFADTS